MPGFADARKTMKYGQTKTESCLYFMMTAFLIGVIAVLLEMLIPGQEFIVGGRTFYISYDFYNQNKLWFLSFASMLGLFLSSIIIKIHQRSVKKRLISVSRIGRN